LIFYDEKNNTKFSSIDAGGELNGIVSQPGMEA